MPGRAEAHNLKFTMSENLKGGVERLFPFVLRARLLLVGRDVLRRSKRSLHFVLITRDISDNSRQEILREFGHYPIVEHYTSEELERHFGLRGTKVLGFRKSTLAQSIYGELKAHRINKAVSGSSAASAPEGEA